MCDYNETKVFNGLFAMCISASHDPRGWEAGRDYCAPTLNPMLSLKTQDAWDFYQSERYVSRSSIHARRSYLNVMNYSIERLDDTQLDYDPLLSHVWVGFRWNTDASQYEWSDGTPYNDINDWLPSDFKVFIIISSICVTA